MANNFDAKIIEWLRSGGLGFMPSDTIYGLSCRALDEKAVERLHMLKKRDLDKPFIVLISDISQLNGLNVDPAQAGPIKDYWPGKISLEFSAPKAPNWLHRGTNKFAIRLPDNPELRALIQQAGPIISTSANIQGARPASSVAEAWRYFGEELDFYVDAGEIKTEPSTIVKIRDGKLVVAREGAVKLKRLSFMLKCE